MFGSARAVISAGLLTNSILVKQVKRKTMTTTFCNICFYRLCHLLIWIELDNRTYDRQEINIHKSKKHKTEQPNINLPNSKLFIRSKK